MAHFKLKNFSANIVMCHLATCVNSLAVLAMSFDSNCVTLSHDLSVSLELHKLIRWAIAALFTAVRFFYITESSINKRMLQM